MVQAPDNILFVPPVLLFLELLFSLPFYAHLAPGSILGGACTDIPGFRCYTRTRSIISVIAEQSVHGRSLLFNAKLSRARLLGSICHPLSMAAGIPFITSAGLPSGPS